MKKKLTIAAVTVLALAVIIVILTSNKARSDARLKNNIITVYPVTVDTVGVRSTSEKISFVGVIAANNDVAVVAETQGRVTAVYAQVGDYKRAGEVLVQLDDEVKKANFALAEANYEKAKKDLARSESLHQEKTITDSQYEAARLNCQQAETQYIVTKRQLSDTRITTPISGIVTARTVDIGSMVPTNAVVANVVDISQLKVKLNVPERDAFRLRAGQPVEVATDVYPGVTFTGRVKSISAKGDESHTYPVEVTLANSGAHPLRTGMFGRASFAVASGTTAMVIPRASIIGSVQDAQVYVVRDGRSHLQKIVVGEEVGNNVTILNGLTNGDVVVVNGQNNLRDGITVTVIR